MYSVAIQQLNGAEPVGARPGVMHIPKPVFANPFILFIGFIQGFFTQEISEGQSFPWSVASIPDYPYISA
jgi:hypothetical protein